MQHVMENMQTCELCLEQIIKTEDFENLIGDEKQNLIILKNLEINVSKDAKICSNCVNISHLTYNFKMSCLTNNDHLKTLIHPGINEKIILEEVIVTKTKSELKNEQKVCRFCLNFSDVNSLMEVNLEQEVILRYILGKCLPEIDTNIVQNPLLCSTCKELLEKLFSFISQSEKAEVLRNLDTETDILVNEHSSTVTVVNNDDNIDKSFVKEENCEGIENPKLQIKSEDFDIDEDIKHSINDSNCLSKEGEIRSKPSSFPSGLTHQQAHWKTVRKLYKCTKCMYQTEYPSNLTRHKKNYEKTFQCNLCSFTACNNPEIVKHKKKVHRNVSESKMFKCQKCPYITKWMGSLEFHNRRRHEDILKPRYKCDECPYEAFWKSRLVKHKVKHRDPSEVNMYKCMMCSFEAKRKHLLRNHVKLHAKIQQNSVKVEQSLSNPVEEKDVKPKPRGRIKENKFVCDICLYQANKKFRLQQHYLIHKEPWEVKVFKCDYCPFVTKWKRSLTSHTVYHNNYSELPKFKCNDCSYETNKKKNLVSHFLVHKNPSQVKMYKCKECPYQTKYRSGIRMHNKKHQGEIYTCDKCSYKTKLKRSFVVHLQYHKEEASSKK